MNKAKIGSVAVLGLVMLASGCGSIGDSLAERGNGHTKQFTYQSAQDGKKADVVPAWLPDSATDVKEVVRTTGNERILVATVKPGTKLNSCDGQANQGDSDAASFDDSTLKASWWKDKSAKEPRKKCGKWSVAIKGDTVFAFVPESPKVKIEKQDTVYH